MTTVIKSRDIISPAGPLSSSFPARKLYPHQVEDLLLRGPAARDHVAALCARTEKVLPRETLFRHVFSLTTTWESHKILFRNNYYGGGESGRGGGGPAV